MIDENGYDWRRAEKPDTFPAGAWRYGGYAAEPQMHSVPSAITGKLTGVMAGEWWAPCNADGSPRPWPEPQEEQSNYDWRRGEIDEVTWQTGWWRWGNRLDHPRPSEDLYSPNECPKNPRDYEWWAPVHEDGNPRPWPEPQAAEVAPPDLEWRRGTVPAELWPSGWWRCGGMGDVPQFGQRRLYGPEEAAVFPRESEWWAPVNEDGSPRPWLSPAKPDWRRLSWDTELSGYWLPGGTGDRPSNAPVRADDGVRLGRAGEWWSPCNADGSPREWPELEEAKKADPAPALQWRRGKIDIYTWQSGPWKYGLQGDRPAYTKAVPCIEKWTPEITHHFEWWAPCNEDGSPRPWPPAPDASMYPGNLSVPLNSSPADEQPAPQPGIGDMAGQLIDLLQERRRLGIERYGTPLQSGNGRRALVDLRDELLDAVLYCQQEIEERRALQEQVKRFGDVAVQVIALLEKRKRLGIDDVVTVVQMLRGVVSAGVEPSGIQPPCPREADNIASYEELDARVVELEQQLADARAFGDITATDNVELAKQCAELTDTCAALREDLRAAKQEAAASAKLDIAVCPECEAKPPYRCKPACSTQALDGASHHQCRAAIRMESRRQSRLVRDAERAVAVEEQRYRQAYNDWSSEFYEAWSEYDAVASAAVELVDALDAGRAPRAFAVNVARELRR